MWNRRVRVQLLCWTLIKINLLLEEELKIENNKIKFFVDGKEVELSIAEVKIDKEIEGEGRFQLGKTYEGTLSNVEFGGEFLNYIEKQRKLMKMQKARENLYKYMD